MACSESVLIGRNLVFSITTHAPDTGTLSDADTAPTYKIYDDADNSLVESGTMVKIDATEDGFYSESLSCDTPNFEEGKTYTLCIKATVDGDTGGMVYGFSTHEEISIGLGVPIKIQGFDAMSGKNVYITGRYV